jgi:hypothetical protein
LPAASLPLKWNLTPRFVAKQFFILGNELAMEMRKYWKERTFKLVPGIPAALLTFYLLCMNVPLSWA